MIRRWPLVASSARDVALGGCFRFRDGGAPGRGAEEDEEADEEDAEEDEEEKKEEDEDEDT